MRKYIFIFILTIQYAMAYPGENATLTSLFNATINTSPFTTVLSTIHPALGNSMIAQLGGRTFLAGVIFSRDIFIRSLSDAEIMLLSPKKALAYVVFDSLSSVATPSMLGVILTEGGLFLGGGLSGHTGLMQVANALAWGESGVSLGAGGSGLLSALVGGRATLTRPHPGVRLERINFYRKRFMNHYYGSSIDSGITATLEAGTSEVSASVHSVPPQVHNIPAGPSYESGERVYSTLFEPQIRRRRCNSIH